MKFTKRNTITLIITWSITIAIFIILFTKINFSDVVKQAGKINIGLFVLICVISIFMHLIVANQRYREVIKLMGCNITLLEAMIIRLGSIPIKLLLPFKSGELLRIAYLKGQHGLKYIKGAGSVFLTYLFSAAALIVFFIIGWVIDKPELIKWIVVILPILICTAVFLVFKKKNNIKDYGPALFYSVIFEGLKIINIFIFFIAFNISIPVGKTLFFVPLVIAASALPFTISGLGTRETSILVLFGYYASKETLLAMGLLISLLDMIIPAIIGFVFISTFLKRLIYLKK
ncbi:MAG: flippase-like domain-containing protein [Elusimicrobia bacterium]|nr:flippase-like domain-containing protein [Elusimicrobiota bacterium]